MTNSLRLLPAVAGLLAWLSTPASAQSVDPSFYYKLSTQFRGNGMKLDVFNGGANNNQPHLVKCGNFTGQFWNIMVSEDGDRVRLTTKFRGPGMCLDIFNGGVNDNQPHVVSCANFTGQLWTLTKTDKRVEGAP